MSKIAGATCVNEGGLRCRRPHGGRAAAPPSRAFAKSAYGLSLASRRAGQEAKKSLQFAGHRRWTHGSCIASCQRARVCGSGALRSRWKCSTWQLLSGGGNDVRLKKPPAYGVPNSAASVVGVAVGYAN